jgi:hypothetical protein
MNIRENIVKLSPSNQYANAMVVFSEIWPIVVKHKKKVVLILLFEVWVHGLVIHHVQELKSLLDLFPFLGGH